MTDKKSEGKSKPYSVRFSAENALKIEKLANARDKSPSEIVDSIVTDYLNTESRIAFAAGFAEDFLRSKNEADHREISLLNEIKRLESVLIKREFNAVKTSETNNLRLKNIEFLLTKVARASASKQ